MANAVYQKAGTSVTWKDSGGDLVMTLQNLAAGAGRQGATKDWAALSTPRPTRYQFRFQCSFESAPIVAEVVEIYWKSSNDNTVWDNDDGTGDIAMSSSDKLRNCQLIGVLVVDEALADIRMSVQGMFENFERYGAPIIYNRSGGDNLQNTANDASLIVTPIYDEIQ
jgi:hypothetical protein